MKKNDFILIGIILIVAIGTLFYMNVSKQRGNKVVVKVDGEIYKEFSLGEDTTFEIEGVNDGTNLLVIEDGHADITDANCPDKLCVKQKQIKYNRETIACLPNKVSVEVISDKESDLDAVAN